MDLILIAGLPGSGKTTLAKSITDAIVCNGKCPMLISDPMDKKTFISNLNELNHRHFDVLIIESVYLCDPMERYNILECLKAHNIEVNNLSWKCFKNNPAQCERNIRSRHDGRIVHASIKNIARVYTYPEGAEILEVYTPDEATPCPEL